MVKNGQNQIPMQIDDSLACYEMLWKKLETTRTQFLGQYKRYCIRNIVRSWLPAQSTELFLWNVCNLCQQPGYQELPPPSLHPCKHREFLIALVSTCTGIGIRSLNKRALDQAYSQVFPRSTPINTFKRGK